MVPEVVAPDPVIEIEPEPVPEPDVFVVASWDVRNGTETFPDRSMPLGVACEYVMKLETRNGDASIGVSLGPPAESLDDPALKAFRDEQYQVFLDSAAALDLTKALNISRCPIEVVRLAREKVYRMTALHKINKKVQNTVVVTLQEGHAVAYWFAGNKLAYRDFVNAVGKADILTEAQVEALADAERIKLLQQR